MEALGWQIPLGVLGAVAMTRLALAPFWMYRELEDETIELRARIAEDEARRGPLRELHAVIARGNHVLKFLRKSRSWDHETAAAWYNAWRMALNDVLVEADMDEQMLIIDARVPLDHVPRFYDDATGVDPSRLRLTETFRVKLERASTLLGQIKRVS